MECGGWSMEWSRQWGQLEDSDKCKAVISGAELIRR